MKDVCGGDGEANARLCPLGWTAIGTIDVCERREECNTEFLHTYRMQRSDSNDRALPSAETVLDPECITPQADRQLTPD